ncbi:MAG: pyridine nucleotide-disulfide oxidoreductase [Chloroflexota bacterium]|nr:MAG: pyridine nucleotide-disulfide oxidoreductase [Chloroflexota bacterium]
MQNNQYDIAVIGGGPGGLQATLMLARTRKRIIVFDDPQPPRNNASHGVHNVLGLDGLLPAKTREIAWQQIDVYQSAELCHEQVTNITKGDDDYFHVTGQQGTSVRAKHVILANGYRDIHPAMPGFVECWGDTIIPCPFCDGYENRDRVWGVVASSENEAHHFPKMLQNWTPHIKLILQPGVSIDADYQADLVASGISVHRGAITHIHHAGSKVEGVSLATGEQIEVGTLLWIPPKQPVPLIHTLVKNLGLAVDDGGFVKTDDTQQTNVPRLWAVGDVQNGRSALDAICTGGKVAQTIIRTWYP